MTLQWYLVDFGGGAGSKADVWCFSKVLRIRPSDKILPTTTGREKNLKERIDRSSRKNSEALVFGVLPLWTLGPGRFKPTFFHLAKPFYFTVSTLR